MTTVPNLAEMSDEDIATLDPVAYQEAVDAESQAQGQDKDTASEDGDDDKSSLSDDDQSTGDSPDDDDQAGDAGGAADDQGSSDDAGEGVDSTSAEDEGDGEADPASAASDSTSDDDQSKDQGESGDAEKDQAGDGTDYKAEYERLMAPFKAAKRMVSLDNVEDARRLLQMGVDYSNKMALLKPHMRVLRTLEKAELLDPSRINFLIDLDKKNPEAIKKLLSEADIDPMSVDLEGSENYSSPDHMIGDDELAVRDVLDNIQDSPKFHETVDVITKVMDKKSRQQLNDSPEVIATLHEHIEAGVYQQVQDRVANERMLGRLTGLSDLEAYYKVGDAMHKAGAFTDATSTTKDSSGKSAQDSGSSASDKEADLRQNRRRAAKPTRGKGSEGGKPRPDFSKMTDKQIEDFDESTLS